MGICECRQFECPTHQGEIYKLPTAVQEQVNMLYQRDIARMAGEGKDTKGMEDEYKTFLAELGGKDSRELGGSGQFTPPPLQPCNVRQEPCCPFQIFQMTLFQCISRGLQAGCYQQ